MSTRTVQRRLRDLPSRVGVYFLLATCLFPEVGYRLVWDELVGGLAGMPVASPSAEGLRDLRRRLGTAPMRALFEVLAGQLAWALLSLYQALRAVMVEAAESVPGTDPDRCCFTVALQTARDQVVQAAGIVPDEVGGLGLIGRRVLARLLPSRRRRVSTRKVKSPMSRYSERRDDGRPDHSRTVTQLAVTVLEPGPEQPPLPAVSRDDRNAVPSQSRRHCILALLQDDRTACGELQRSPPASATSGWTPCIGNSPDGRTVASSTRSAPVSTQPRPGHQLPCKQRQIAKFLALGEAPVLSRARWFPGPRAARTAPSAPIRSRAVCSSARSG
ncbi:transposase domain-containing protein [Streptomyces sp. NPDC001880]